MPKISVVMSVYNGADFLMASMDSILSQTCQDFEFIIVDDGSTDDSAGIIAGYRDSRIILVRQENRGVAAALNRGLAHATGEYIARQDADDISMPERFSLQIRFMEAHPEIAVLGTAALLIDPAGRPFSSFLPYTRHERLVSDLLRGVCPLMHGSVMARREAICNAGMYKPEFSHAQDVELWLRMSARYHLANLRQMLYQLRKHDSSITQRAHIDLLIKAFAKQGGFSTNTSAEKWVKFAEDFKRDFSRGLWRDMFEAENSLRQARISFARGKLWNGAQNLSRAVKLNPDLVMDTAERVFHRVRRTYFP